MFQMNFQSLATRACANAALTAILLLALAGTAQARTETIRWTHGGSIDAVGFRMYSSSTPGPADSTKIADLSLAEVGPNAQGEYFYTIDVPDQDTVYVAVTAVSSQNAESFRSNEKVLAPPVNLDRDGDGVNDDVDAFPDDPTEWADSDGDGVGDNADVFPNDPSEWADADGDGYGDNIDFFDDDPTEWQDSDGDSYGDNSDAFPNDPNEWSDRDGDGVGDNSDAYPDDPSRYQFDTVLSPYRVNAGSTSDYETTDGRIWTRDMGFWNTGVANAIDPDIDIAGTTTRDEIYRSSRSDPESGDEMLWSFPITNGAYRVVLHFSENVYTAPGQRMFDVEIEGRKVLTNFDIFANAANRQHRAVVRNFTVQVTDGVLEIEFLHIPGYSDPTVMGIEVVSLEALEGDVLTTPGKPFVIDIN